MAALFSKTAKLPPISDKTKLLAFDLEANGLHGQAFAVGAVLIDASGAVTETFVARCPIQGPTDPWVQQNILPAITNMPISHQTYEALREAFWRWYLTVEPEADYVLVNNGYPVEHRFLIDCQEADLQTRYWQHPYPVLDLSSLLLMVTNKSLSKGQLLNKVKASGSFVPHHPLDDAKVTALMAFEAFRQTGLIQ
ncbi:MAG TPA: hypothetical protein VLF87_00800 [Patescibacteria group bacterium]|nr:hypothetical protein [Patescibacteria group bacterium]